MRDFGGGLIFPEDRYGIPYEDEQRDEPPARGRLPRPATARTLPHRDDCMCGCRPAENTEEAA